MVMGFSATRYGASPYAQDKDNDDVAATLSAVDGIEAAVVGSRSAQGM
ncbi:hypothetical protein Q2941_11580 [Bradyrhizobium sp. UFLA05-153]